MKNTSLILSVKTGISVVYKLITSFVTLCHGTNLIRRKLKPNTFCKSTD